MLTLPWPNNKQWYDNRGEGILIAKTAGEFMRGGVETAPLTISHGRVLEF